MKKTLLILLASVCFKIYGQLDYTFTKSTGTYTALSSPVVVGAPWGTPLKTKLPFQFTYFNKPFDSLNIFPYGVTFTTLQTDLISMGQENYKSTGGELSYLIAGTAPDRIAKVQFKNLSVPTSDTSEEYTVNYQIWLYEKTGNIEFHYGNCIVTDINFTEFYFGFRDADGSPYLAISGTVASPVLFKVTSVGAFKGIAAHPSNGTVYTFAPYTPSTGITEIIRPYSFSVSDQSFSFSSAQNSTLVISDISGKVISEMNPQVNTQFVYDYSTLSSGMYLLTINSNNQLYSEKIIVK